MRLARDVVGPEVEDRRRIVAPAQVTHELAVRREAHLPQCGSLQVRRIEEPLDRQVAGSGRPGKAQGRRECD
jgi:hypothetical protein